MNPSTPAAVPLLTGRGLTKRYDGRGGCVDVDIDIYPGEVLCIVGESGSGKSTLLNALALRTPVNDGALHYRTAEHELLDLFELPMPRRRTLARTDWGFVHQNARDGLRHGVSAGANIGEPLMANGARHYGRLRETAADWMNQVELDAARIDELPSAFSGSCLWTSRRRGWMYRCRRACWTCCARLRPSFISQHSLSRMILVWRVCWRIV
jgi:putative phosphonate transport system ATP-binding protein